MEKVKPVILMICDYYLPGFESGGAMRTLVNMVDRLSDSYDFKVLTRDHDGPLNKTSYVNVGINEWNRVENAEVYYLSKDNIRKSTLKKLVSDTNPDVIYLNSFFSPLTIMTLLLRRSTPIILAPEGELVPGALSIKPLKKQLYMRAAKVLKLLDQVNWKAASEFEREYIQNHFPNNFNIFIAPNMPPRTILGDFAVHKKPEKKRGAARMVFLSRFMRKKNFKWLLDIIRNVRGDLSIDIYGPIEDDAYWEECDSIISTLPMNIKVESKGAISHDDVPTTLAQYHFFVLPTLGENFGHIFVEALAAGCPIIISDRSPWRDLEKEGIGWDIALERPDAWLSVVNDCVAMDNYSYGKMSRSAREYAVAWLSDASHEESNREVLEFALSKKAPVRT